jgi:hypothetical protein
MNQRAKNFEWDDPELEAALLSVDEEIPSAEQSPKARRPGPRGRRLHREFFLGPVWLLKEIERAHAWRALPLILAVYRRMYMRKTDSTTLTEQIWTECGVLNEPGRRTVLAQLRKVSGIIVATPEHRLQWRYRLTLGTLWGDFHNGKPK